MPLVEPHRRFALAWPALLATVFLLLFLLGTYTLFDSRRVQQNLSRELEERGQALLGVLEASSRSAITSQTVAEEAVAQRLLDNARFIDFLLPRTVRPADLIRRITEENRLASVELLDGDGKPLPIPPPGLQVEGPPWAGGAGGRAPGGMGRGGMQGGEGSGRMGMMRRMMPEAEPSETQAGQAGRRPAGMPFMWGQRWGIREDPALLFPSLPKNATIRRFWEGSAFGVAVPARSFAGVIVIHADASSLLTLQKEIGLQRLVEDLGRQAGVAGVELIDEDFTVLASTVPAMLGQKVEDPILSQAVQGGGGAQGRRVLRPDGRDVYEIVKPMALAQGRKGIVRLALGAENLAAAAAQAQRSILGYSLGLLLVGIAGAVTIFWIQARHLAERRSLEAAVVREQRLSAMGNLAAGVAHEIRNPLNAISMGLQRLRMEFAPAEDGPREEYGRFTRIMQSEIGRLNTIVDRFLTLARPLRLNLTDEPLAPLLQEMLALLAPQASAQAVQIHQEIRLQETRVRMDRQQVVQAVMNVLLNALQAMPNGGRLAVDAEPVPEGHMAEIRISDTGPGIPREQRERIFEPYFTTKEGGTGLGLPLAQKIFREHGGEIALDPTTQAGAAFALTLPVLMREKDAE